FVLGIRGPRSLVVISTIVLIIFGGKKIPEFGGGIGSSLKEFKWGGENIDRDESDDSGSKE
uniref:twin-arginine translocase TatA/TatE family subunit n=1 Tax=Staphylococcus haemolyticus TaxID=1283 RepID=UPI0011A72C70